MKSISKAMLAVLVVLFVSGISCGKTGGDSIFIPDLSANWFNKDDATNLNTFFFPNISTPNANSSAFTGNENPLGGGAQLHFTGSFTNHNIQFTYDAGSGTKTGKSYSGTISDDSKTMTISGTGLTSLTLVKR